MFSPLIIVKTRGMLDYVFTVRRSILLCSLHHLTVCPCKACKGCRLLVVVVALLECCQNVITLNLSRKYIFGNKSNDAVIRKMQTFVVSQVWGILLIRNYKVTNSREWISLWSSQAAATSSQHYLYYTLLDGWILEVCLGGALFQWSCIPIDGIILPATYGKYVQ